MRAYDDEDLHDAGQGQALKRPVQQRRITDRQQALM